MNAHSGKVLVAFLIVLLALSVVVHVVAISRWREDAASLSSALDGKRSAEERSTALDGENKELREANNRLAKELEQIEDLLAPERAPAPTEESASKQPPVGGGSDAPTPPSGEMIPPPVEQTPAEAKPLTTAEILALIKSENQRDRHRAFEAIKNLPTAEKLALIKEVLSADVTDQGLKSRALRMLSEIGGTEAAQIAMVYMDGGSAMRWNAILASEIVAKSADATMMSSLYAAYAGDNDLLKQGAALALRRLGDQQYFLKYVDSTAERLSNSDGTVRQEAVRTLASLHDPVTVPYLARALSDTDSETRMTAIWGLGAIHDKSAIPYLQPLTQDPNEEVRKSAQQAINRINNPTPPREEGFRRFGRDRQRGSER